MKPTLRKSTAYVALTTLTVLGSSMAADIPEPANCTVSPGDTMGGLVFCPTDPAPSPASVNTITVRNSANLPMANCPVVIEADPPIVLCGSSSVVGVTDASGRVVLTLGGGGCAIGTVAAIVRADGEAIRSFDKVKSPDYDGSGGDLKVDLADLREFTGEFLGTSPGLCHDYDNNDHIGLEDVIVFGPAFTSGNSCAP